MKKVVVLVPVHCAPKVVMMTLGTWLEAADGSYEAEIVLGVHQNYHHYHNGLASLQGLPVSLSMVPEINWFARNTEDSLIRYSKMHAVNLRAMLEMVRNRTFDHLAILDHDLVFKKDFVGWAMGQSEDLIGNYLGDRTESVPVQTPIAGELTFLPKFSVWHLAMSRRFYDKIMEDVGLISPEVCNGYFYDIFTKIVEKNKYDWGLSVQVLKEVEMAEMVQHLWSMSFNFGPWTGGQDYGRKLRELEAAYDKRFPNGIGHLFRKVGL